MKIPKPIKAIGKAVKRLMGDEEQIAEDKQLAKLEKWKKRLDDALIEHGPFRDICAANDAQYNGSKTVKTLAGNMPISNRYSDDTDVQGTQNARQVVNVVFQLIESQIDISVPKPTVEPVEGNNDENKKMIEGTLCAIAEGPELERINSENERIAKKNSLSVFKVRYNPDYAAHKYRGRIEILNPHPVNIIPQPNVYRIKDMDYMFHIESNRTVDQICRMYGEEFRDKLEDGSNEYGYLEELSETNNEATSNGLFSVVECWYKDKDNDVGLMAWVNDEILKDMPKFFYPRDEAGEISEDETLEVEIPAQPGPDGQPGQPTTETVTVKRSIPKNFPFIEWYNIPREKKFYGKSDPEIISDQQEGIKKMLSIEEEKHVKGTTKIFVRKGAGIPAKLDNALSKIIEVDDPQGDIKVVDLKSNDKSLIEMYTIYVQAAKDALGITEASQGRSEGASMSGRAIELLAQNTAGRISVKVFEKHIAYTELYQMIFEFMMAYIDDIRPFRQTDAMNNPIFGFFDKSKLLRRDDAGEWYYPEWSIKIQPDTGLPKDKRFILDAANNSGDRMDEVAYWTVLDSIGFPNAKIMLDRAKAKEQAAQQAAQAEAQAAQQQQPQQKPPSASIAFKDLPLDGQIQLGAQAGLKLDPNILAAKLKAEMQAGQPQIPGQMPTT